MDMFLIDLMCQLEEMPRRGFKTLRAKGKEGVYEGR